jgi:[protein-PII] uridylyltransferase
LLKRFPLPNDAALAAVGGYGRGELYPFSDVDLLILLNHAPTPSEESKLSDLVAALWDLGIEPGYSVRTIDQCLSEAEADITVQTSLLENRYLGGRRSLVNQFNQVLLANLDAKAFYRAKLAEMRQRHARYQDTPYALEPNCKESPGGAARLAGDSLDGSGRRVWGELAAICQKWRFDSPRGQRVAPSRTGL